MVDNNSTIRGYVVFCSIVTAPSHGKIRLNVELPGRAGLAAYVPDADTATYVEL